MSLVQKHIQNWKAIAKRLGFNEKKVKRIESNYVQPERCLHATIWKWWHNNKWKDDTNIPEPNVKT